MNEGDILSSRYRVGHELSRHGLSQRCMGERIHDGKRVILETLHESVLHDETALHAFRYEVSIADKLKEPYFMGVIDSFTVDHSFYVVWEYVDAHPLTRNDSLALLSTEQVMRFIAALVRAIDVAHHHGVVHGALSTDAILVTPHLEPIIIDFAVPGAALTTDPGMVGGISVYRAAAPELFTGEPMDASCDLYSLGTIGQFLLSVSEDSRRISPGQGDETPVFSRARSLVNSLTSSHREIRLDAAQQLMDPSFLDSMATPPQGNTIIQLNKNHVRSIKHLHKIQKTSNDQTIAVVETLIKAAVIAGLAIAALVLLASVLR